MVATVITSNLTAVLVYKHMTCTDMLLESGRNLTAQLEETVSVQVNFPLTSVIRHSQADLRLRLTLYSAVQTAARKVKLLLDGRHFHRGQRERQRYSRVRVEGKFVTPPLSS
jgi:hypothetical protein